MIQPQTQTREYWVSNFTVLETDLENLYNYLLEVEKPQTISQLSQAIIKNRVAAEKQEIERHMAGRTVYQPKKEFAMGEDIIFPSLQFASGKVTDIRQGYNPEHGDFTVIGVQINGKEREFAAGMDGEHILNLDAGSLLERIDNVNMDELYALYTPVVEERLTETLNNHEEFIRLGQEWFVKALLIDINVGHLHLAEAILDMNEGGPLTPSNIIEHLDLDKNVLPEVQRFSLNFALINDDRFDEVAPKEAVAWFLRRLEPDAVNKTPARLVYNSISYDRALLSPQLRLLERELDDEWSDIDLPLLSQTVVLTLTYPHRIAGTLPLSSSTRPLFPLGLTQRQRVLFVDEDSGEEMPAWIVQNQRYIYGLADWYKKHEIPIGGFITLRPGPNVGIIMINYDRRRKKKEWVRLATEESGRIRFSLERRSVGSRYDDLIIVGTDYASAIDALWQKAEKERRTLASLLAEVVPALASLTPQNSVHAKTIYSGLNMLRRVPPGPMFAELVRHPAFRALGDQYWQFDNSRWREA